jgi:hypothetical protein
MSSNPVQVFVAAYQSEDGAGAALKDFRAMDREGSIELIDAAVAVHTADGKVKIEETARRDRRRHRRPDLPAEHHRRGTRRRRRRRRLGQAPRQGLQGRGSEGDR